MGEKLGIKETKEMVDLILEGISVGVKASEDGKVTLDDATLLLGLVPKLGPALKDADQIPKELADLDAAEAAELVTHVTTNLAVTNQKAKDLINDALGLAYSAYKLIKTLKKNYASDVA